MKNLLHLKLFTVLALTFPSFSDALDNAQNTLYHQAETSLIQSLSCPGQPTPKPF